MKATTRARLRELARRTDPPAVREIAELALAETDRAQQVFETVFGGRHTLSVLLMDSRIPEEQRAVALRRVATRILTSGQWKPCTPALRRALSERAVRMETTVERVQRDVLALGLNEALHSGRPAARAAKLPSPFYAMWLVQAAKYRAEMLLLDGRRRGSHAAVQRVKSAGRRVPLDAVPDTALVLERLSTESDEAERDERLRRLSGKTRRGSQERRLIAFLRTDPDLDVQNAAAALGIKPATVRVMAHRLRQKAGAAGL